MTSTFLTAEWRKLAMANYVVDEAVLQHYVPAGTVLDTWDGRCYVSLVGFMFLNTKLKGFTIPCHSNFEEVNLRFYVRHEKEGEVRRGVVFIKELVPRAALTLVANRVYNENYQTVPMRHNWKMSGNQLQVEYHWWQKDWNSFTVLASPNAMDIAEGSEEEFITEHYWGYTKITGSITSEYQVTHPRWQVYPVEDYLINVDFGNVYDDEFAFLKYRKPVSVMLAEGSAISVKAGTKFTTSSKTVGFINQSIH